MSREQDEEIKTIKERMIAVRLSDADCVRLAEKCGRNGLTVAELLENFIGDLVGGTFTNGSDEERCANEWFDCCWFGMKPEPTLLQHLLDNWMDPEEYLEIFEAVKDARAELDDLKEHPEEEGAEESASCLKDFVVHKEKELEEMRSGWNPEGEPDMDLEVRRIKNWVRDRDALKGGNDNFPDPSYEKPEKQMMM